MVNGGWSRTFNSWRRRRDRIQTPIHHHRHHTHNWQQKKEATVRNVIRSQLLKYNDLVWLPKQYADKEDAFCEVDAAIPTYTTSSLSVFLFRRAKRCHARARACTLVPSLNLKTRETAGCLYPMGPLDQCLKFVKHLDWTRKVEQAKETWFRCIDRATIPTMQLRGKKIAELEEYSGNCSLKHLPSGFSVCTVIYGKDLVSSQCIKGRTEEKREAPLRAPNCLSIFLCEIYKWRLGTSLYLKSDSHFVTACVRVFFFWLAYRALFFPGLLFDSKLPKKLLCILISNEENINKQKAKFSMLAIDAILKHHSENRNSFSFLIN